MLFLSCEQVGDPWSTEDVTRVRGIGFNLGASRTHVGPWVVPRVAVLGITACDLRHDWAHRPRAAGWPREEIAVYAGHQTKDGAPAAATTPRYTLLSRRHLKEFCET